MSRALPSLRDGLSLTYSGDDRAWVTPDKPHKKSAQHARDVIVSARRLICL